MSPGVWVETSLGLNLKAGKDQHKDDNKFFGSCLQSFMLLLFGSGVVIIPTDCGVYVGQGFCSVFYTSVS